MCIYYKYNYFILLAYYNDVVVGGVCCRIETEDNKRKLYIMTLGCLAAYRRHGVGKSCDHHVIYGMIHIVLHYNV